MKVLAEALLQEWWFVIDNRKVFIEAFANDDFITDHYENIAVTMDEMEPAERQAIRDAARDRLRSETETDAFGHSRAALLSPEGREFLNDMINYPEPE